MKRAAVCIGVNRAGNMTQLQAAVEGAKQFEAWAKTQGFTTRLLIDEQSSPVTLSHIFTAVNEFVAPTTYDVLVIYFSGHGILIAPNAEYWLLSQSPQNPNEAVNLSRSIEDARNSQIPHVVFVSDACRSAAGKPPLSGVSGGVIFPNQALVGQPSEVDVYYATRPGNPAWEAPEAEAVNGYSGIFTSSLLRVLNEPKPEMVESGLDGSQQLKVISSRKLKEYLEATVPIEAAAINIKLRQNPFLHVETAAPKKFFAVVKQAVPMTTESVVVDPFVLPTLPASSIDTALDALGDEHFKTGIPPSLADAKFARECGLTDDVQRLAATRGRAHFETRTGFSVFGARPLEAYALRWSVAGPIFKDHPNDSAAPWNIRLKPQDGIAERKPSTVLIEFDSGIGIPLAILPGFIGTVVVDDGRVTSVNYVPSASVQSSRYQEYQSRETEIENMTALAAVAARHGRFVVEGMNAGELANRIRQGKGIDPTLGIFAAYAYAQVGKYKDVNSVFTYMRHDEIEIPVPFDVVMLATRYKNNEAHAEQERYAPFCPMLAQGWALLMEGDPLYRPVHKEIRQHLLPSLWTTVSKAGVDIIRTHISTGGIK